MLIFQPTLPARGATGVDIRPEQIAEFQPTLPARGATSIVDEEEQTRIIKPFQPTLPARGATVTRRNALRGRRDFNPRSPHGERHGADAAQWRAAHFNPRSPHGERLATFKAGKTRKAISTHAPRTGSDGAVGGFLHYMHHFNPRSPHGERQKRKEVFCYGYYFNPRSPHGERRP